MRVFFDASAFLKVLRKEEGYGKVVERLVKVKNGEHVGYTDTIVIAEMVYAFLSRGLNEEGMKARAYIQGIPNLTIIEEMPTSISHRGAELKKKYFRKSEKTLFSLRNGIRLTIAGRHREIFMAPDRDFKNATEVEFV